MKIQNVTADVGAFVWVGSCPKVYRGGGVWTTATILEFAERYPYKKVPGSFVEIEFGPPTSVPIKRRPLPVGALKGGNK